MLISLDELIARTLDPNSLKPDGYLTIPRSYGVYEIQNADRHVRIYRQGNYPVRLHELQKEFPECRLTYLFSSKEDAIQVVSILNNRKEEKLIKKAALKQPGALSNLNLKDAERSLVHPSQTLVKLFKRKPYQGVAPDRAHFLFIGLDANYDENIGTQSIFSKVLEYHEDGAEFWRSRGVHHPFLLPEYLGDGRRYHQNFKRIGFTSEHASLISFVELFHLPTVGRNKLSVSDLNLTHLKTLNQAILEGEASHIFISPTVANLMRASGAFTWLPKVPRAMGEILPVLFQNNKKTIYSLLHFSVYGKYQRKLFLQLKEVRKLFQQF